MLVSLEWLLLLVQTGQRHTGCEEGKGGKALQRDQLQNFGPCGSYSMALQSCSFVHYRHPQKHYVHKKLFSELFLLSG